MCEGCKRLAGELDGIKAELMQTNGLLARLVDHIGVPSVDGESALVRTRKAWEAEMAALVAREEAEWRENAEGEGE